MKYNLEIDTAVEKINEQGAVKVLIQLPDGLKPKAQEIKDTLEEQTSAEIFIWLGSCFGACDVPYYTENFGIDMIIQWGHSPWKGGHTDEPDTSDDTPEQPSTETEYVPLFG